MLNILKNKLVFAAALVFAMLWIHPHKLAAQTTLHEQPAAPSPQQHNSPDLLIGSGDLLEVSVLGAPDFVKQIRVNSSGEISLPLIGAVKVAGLSTSGAEKFVAKKLVDGGYFSDPQVSIFQKEYATQGISILGEVMKPGIYPLLGRRSVFDAISAAGGTTPRAGNTVSITHRNAPDKPETIPLSYAPGDSRAGVNAEVAPGDTVVVSKAGIVYVVGDVGKPGGFVMENSQMTVLQALAMAQGANQNAALNSARLIRGTSKQHQEIPIPLKEILAAKSPDLNLQSEDIVFVPNSAGKTAVRKSMEAILQTATGIAIYRR
ncbi:MAG: polysaccharide export protein [Candidatus Angelobacter sp.]|jgi:polysaccharide export outer membrane protein|nr:polysaccharide export protein [Candidatus Angelobacter sp.]